MNCGSGGHAWTRAWTPGTQIAAGESCDCGATKWSPNAAAAPPPGDATPPRLEDIVKLWKEGARDTANLSDAAFRALIATWSFEPITEADIARARELFPDPLAPGDAGPATPPAPTWTDAEWKAFETVMRGFDEGVFVRSIEHDHESGWAIKQMPFFAALGVLERARLTRRG